MVGLYKMTNLDEIIKINSVTNKAKKLRLLLEEMNDSYKEFVADMLESMDTEEKRQKMIDILEKYELEPSDVIGVAIDIEDEIEPQFEDVI